MRSYDKQNKRINSMRDEIEKLKEDNRKLNDENINIREILDSTLHEVRRFSSQLSNFSERLSRQSCDSLHDVSKLAQSIFYTAGMISSRLAYTDIELNPSVLSSQTCVRSGIYKKFDKASRILAEEAKRKKVEIKFLGESHMEIDALPVFELLPFVLLDNAIKYSPERGEVSIEFREKDHQLEIIIKSSGPSVEPDEIAKLFDKKFRGINVKNMPGQGLGLFLAKQVCEFHGFSVLAEVGRDLNYSISGINYSEIKFILNYRHF